MKHTQLIDIQRANEVRVYSRADNQKRTQLQMQVDNQQEYNLSYGQDAVLTILPIVEKEVHEMNERFNQHTKKFYAKYVKPLQQQSPEERRKVEKQMAEIVAINLTATLTKETTLTSVSARMTNNAFHILNVNHDERKEEAQQGIKFFGGLVMVVAENSDIFTIEQVEGRENRLFLSETWKEHVEECQENYKASVSGYEPMVVKPTAHASLVDGEAGYLISKSPLLKHPTKDADHRVLSSISEFTAENNPDFFAYVNRVQETPYVVNTKLLDILLHYYDERGISFKKFPHIADQEEIERGAAEEIEKRNKKRLNFAEYNKTEYVPLAPSTERKVLASHTAKMTEKVRKTRSILTMACDYAIYDELYYPVFLDSRARLYPYASGSLSTQGDEVAKALIQFANKKKLTTEGMEALFDSLANALGHDKKVIEVKREIAKDWFTEHLPEFMNGNWDWFFTADIDEPVNALAICIELTEAAKDPEYLCGYIAHRDARVSGSSIIGTALRDKGLMELTSVIDWSKDGKLGDAYVSAANVALDICRTLADKGDAVANDLYSYRDELFNRSVFKHVVMTWCSYGLTDFSLRKYNSSVFEWEKELSAEHKVKFDTIMLKALSVAIPACSRFLETYRKVGNLVAKRDGKVEFINPLSGFPVAFSAHKTRKVRVEVAQPFRIIKLNLIVPTGKVDTMAIANAMAPNTIHSIDASLLYRVSHVCDHDLSLIHDSIGSHPNDVSETVAAYATGMYKVATSDVLNDVLEQLGVKERVEPIDTASSDDLESIKDSKHILV